VHAVEDQRPQLIRALGVDLDARRAADPGVYASILYERSDSVGGTPSIEIHSQRPDQLWSLILDRMHSDTATIERVDVGGIPQAIQALDLRLQEVSAQITELGTPTDDAGRAELENLQAQYQAFAAVRERLTARLGLNPALVGHDAALITLPEDDRHWLIWRQDGATVEVDIGGLTTEEVKQLIPALLEIADPAMWEAAISG
jgi:hypothetical protein